MDRNVKYDSLILWLIRSIIFFFFFNRHSEFQKKLENEIWFVYLWFNGAPLSLSFYDFLTVFLICKLFLFRLFFCNFFFVALIMQSCKMVDFLMGIHGSNFWNQFRTVFPMQYSSRNTLMPHKESVYLRMRHVTSHESRAGLCANCCLVGLSTSFVVLRDLLLALWNLLFSINNYIQLWWNFPTLKKINFVIILHIIVAMIKPSEFIKNL